MYLSNSLLLLENSVGHDRHQAMRLLPPKSLSREPEINSFVSGGKSRPKSAGGLGSSLNDMIKSNNQQSGRKNSKKML
jgi:hypothetical protein